MKYLENKSDIVLTASIIFTLFMEIQLFNFIGAPKSSFVWDQNFELKFSHLSLYHMQV